MQKTLNLMLQLCVVELIKQKRLSIQLPAAAADEGRHRNRNVAVVEKKPNKFKAHHLSNLFGIVYRDYPKLGVFNIHSHTESIDII